MPRQRRCWVPNCPNNRVEVGEKLKLFRFPRNTKRCLKWLMAIGDPTLASCPWGTLISGRHVCINHFMPHMISATNRVLHNAVPCLFLNTRGKLPNRRLWLSSESILKNRERDAPFAGDDVEEENGRITVPQLTSHEPAPDNLRNRCSLNTLRDSTEVKQEPDDIAEQEDCNFTEEDGIYSLQREVEDEEEELKPLLRVFLDPDEVPDKDVQQEQKDPLAI